MFKWLRERRKGTKFNTNSTNPGKGIAQSYLDHLRASQSISAESWQDARGAAPKKCGALPKKYRG